MQEHETFFTFSRARILFSVSVILALPRWPAEQDYFFAFFKASKEKREAGVPSSVSRLSRPSPASVSSLLASKTQDSVNQLVSLFS